MRYIASRFPPLGKLIMSGQMSFFRSEHPLGSRTRLSHRSLIPTNPTPAGVGGIGWNTTLEIERLACGTRRLLADTL